MDGKHNGRASLSLQNIGCRKTNLLGEYIYFHFYPQEDVSQSPSAYSCRSYKPHLSIRILLVISVPLKSSHHARSSLVPGLLRPCSRFCRYENQYKSLSATGSSIPLSNWYQFKPAVSEKHPRLRRSRYHDFGNRHVNIRRQLLQEYLHLHRHVQSLGGCSHLSTPLYGPISA